MKSLGYICFVFCFGGLCLAQTPQLDSLKLVLKTAKHDTVKCKILDAMVGLENNDSIWPTYNDQMHEIARTGINNSDDASVIHFLKIKLGLSYINKGYLEQHVKENSIAAIDNYNKAIEVLKSVNYLNGLASAYNNLGSAYENIGDVKKAIEYYNLALTNKEKNADKAATALPLNNMGMIFYRQGDYKGAIKYYLKSIAISKEIEDKHGVAYASNNMGLTYQKMKNYRMAEVYFQTAAFNWESINNQRLLSYVYNNLGSLYLETGDTKAAQKMLDKSFKISLELNDKHVQAYTNLNYAKIAVYEKDPLRAEKNALEALKLSKELAFPENIRDVALVLCNIYSLEKKYASSLEMYELHIRMRDSLNNEQTRKASIKSDLRYEFEKKAIADSVKVMEEKKLAGAQLKHEKTQRYSLYAGLSLLGLFAVFMMNRYRVINAQKKIITEQTREVEAQKGLVEEKQKEILDSIHYAQRIQRSHLPTEVYLSGIFSRLKK
jgi:tetratricopeptide (TPR) repeat protein